jgi:hypothetical protein
MTYEETLQQLINAFEGFPIVSAFLSALEDGAELEDAWCKAKELRHTVDVSLVECCVGRLRKAR